MQRQSGFTLLEVLVTLGIIGTLGAMILPNLGLSTSSQMTIALRDFTTSMRATYDNAVLTGRVHRMVLEMKTGAYWAEAAPLGFVGRPPLAEEDSASETFKRDARVRLKEELDRIAAEPRKAEGKVANSPNPPNSQEQRTYTPRSLLVVQRKVLDPIKWSEVDDAILFKRQLPSEIAFASVVTEAMRGKLEFANAGKADQAYVYFFPWGQASQAGIQVGVKAPDGAAVNDAGQKFTIILDPLSGHSELLEGFQEADFVKDNR